MAFLQLRVESAHPEFAEELLLACGALSVSLVDAADDPVLEPPPGATPLWNRTVAIGLFDLEADLEHAARMLRAHLPEQAALRIDTQRVEDQDWVRVWLQDCEPLKFGSRLWVCPQQKRIDEAGCVTVLLDPGLAFGTGTHPSTALCLEWLAGVDLTCRALLDFGCGSGILGIAALKLGAAHCTAVDIDAQAIQAAQDNAAINQVGDRLQVHPHDRPFDASRQYDAVLANILARPLIELAPRLIDSLRIGGDLVLAGLLERQADEVRQAYEAQVAFSADVHRDGWTRLHGRRRS